MSDIIEVDGHRWHTRWLRDACQCDHWLHAGSGERLRDVADLEGWPAVRAVELTDDALIVAWDEAEHGRCVFRRDWLAAHRYDGGPSHAEVDPPPRPWDAETIEREGPGPLPATTPFSTWAAHLWTFGFVRLVDLDPAKLEGFISSVGPLLPISSCATLVWDVRAGQSETDLSYGAAGTPLAPHTDQTASAARAFLQFLCCRANTVTGGAGVVVDGLAVVRDFARQTPEHFDTLTRYPVTWGAVFDADRVAYHRRGLVLDIDERGALREICFNPHRRLPLSVDFEHTEAVLDAHTALVRLMADRRYWHRFRYRPGEVLIVDNRRVLHGREAFEAGSGARHLRVAYSMAAHFEARWRYETGRPVPALPPLSTLM